jgi:hypothetical protein
MTSALKWEYVPGVVCCNKSMREWRVRWRDRVGVLVYCGMLKKGEQHFYFAMPHDGEVLFKHRFATEGKTYAEVIEHAKMISSELLTTRSPKALYDLGKPWVMTLMPPTRKTKAA